MKKIILILFCLIYLFSFSDTLAIQGKILSINKEKNIALIKEEPKLNFFEKILSFFNLKKQEPKIYEIQINTQELNKVSDFMFFQRNTKQDIEKINVGDTIEISNVFENFPKQEPAPTYETTDLNVDFINVFSDFEKQDNLNQQNFYNTPTTIFKHSDKIGVMVTTKPSLDSKTECLTNKDCMFCNGACISLLKTNDISYCNNVPPKNLNCVCQKGYCIKSTSNNYLISEEIKHCSFRSNPVCGVDGTTYLNECFANASNVEIECRKSCPCVAPTTTTTAYQTTTIQQTTTTVYQTTTTIPTPTTTKPINEETIKNMCEMFDGIWYSSKQECQKTTMEEMGEFQEWCLAENGFFTDNIPCPKGEICLAVVTAGCNFNTPYITPSPTTTTVPVPTPPFPTTTHPGVTTTTHPQSFPPKDFKCENDSDCANFKPQECPDLKGIICQYECLDDHCAWIVKEKDIPTTTTTKPTTTTYPLPTVPPLPPNNLFPEYPEKPLKYVCPKINYPIPCFNHSDCEIQLNHLITEKGEYVRSNCLPRCINRQCQILDLGVDYPIDMSPEQTEPNLIEDLYLDFLSLKSMFANIFKLK